MDVEEQGKDARRDKTATVAIMLRVREDLRLTLEQAAKGRRVSLNQEIVDRLEYVRDRVGLLPQVLELAYGPHLAGILMLLGIGMEEAGKLRMFAARHVAKTDTWTEQPAAYDRAWVAAVALLLALRPTRTELRGLKAYHDKRHLHRVLTDLARAIRGRSDAPMEGTYRSPRVSPRGDARTIRSLLGPIAKRMAEPKVEMALRLLAESERARANNGQSNATRTTAPVLAKALLALINSSPRTPTQQEIVIVIEQYFLAQGASKSPAAREEP